MIYPANQTRQMANQAGAVSDHPPHDPLRVAYGSQFVRVSPQAKFHVITQIRQAKQSARIAGLANRVGQILPSVKKSISRNQRRVIRLALKF